MKLIGITGPSGAGKSTALAYLARRGVTTIDTDKVYHRLLETDAGMARKIAMRFPGACIDGKIDRKLLAGIVFSDPKALHDLETATHPPIKARVDKMLADYAAAGVEVAAIEAVSLIESGMAKDCDMVIAVLSGGANTARIQARDSLTPGGAKRRLASQKSDDFYREGAHIIITNDGSESVFDTELDVALMRLNEERDGS